VHKICERCPGAYWRKLEAEQAYPTEFITELTQGGFPASLIPEEYGGSGLPLRAAAVILEEVNASGRTASQGHAQMYIMATLLLPVEAARAGAIEMRAVILNIDDQQRGMSRIDWHITAQCGHRRKNSLYAAGNTRARRLAQAAWPAGSLIWS
jgi:alkylation response protein AidB-like acyl-CoA dehydrogenase